MDSLDGIVIDLVIELLLLDRIEYYDPRIGSWQDWDYVSQFILMIMICPVNAILMELICPACRRYDLGSADSFRAAFVGPFGVASSGSLQEALVGPIRAASVGSFRALLPAHFE